MPFSWNEDLLPVSEDTNRPGLLIHPDGLVLHSTANPGVGAAAHRTYFLNAYRAASAHTFTDWEQALRIIPDGLGADAAEKAWHAGRTANRLYIGHELCEAPAGDRAKFDASYVRFIWGAADCCLHYGWGLERVWSHHIISQTYPTETGHVDPDPYLQTWGLTWQDMLTDVGKELARRKAAQATQMTIALPTGQVATGELRDGVTWICLAGVWAPLRPLAETLGCTVQWVGKGSPGPNVIVTYGRGPTPSVVH